MPSDTPDRSHDGDEPQPLPSPPERAVDDDDAGRAPAPRRLAILGVLLSTLVTVPALAAHPQTVWDAAGLARLRAGRATTHAALAANLKKYLEQHRATDLGANVAGYAMAARIWEDPTFEQAAVAKLVAFCGRPWASDGDLAQSSDLSNGAIAYDVLWDLLSADQRGACRGRIAASARGLASLAQGGAWWVDDMVQNHNWVNHSALGVAGQALEGEDPDALDWQAIADGNFARIRRILDLIPDGSWHEGVGYMEFGVSRLAVYAIGAARRGHDWDLGRMPAALGGYILHVQQPNHPRVHVMTHGDWNWSRPGLLFSLRWAASRFQDPLAEEAARRWDLEPRLTRAEFGLYYGLEYAVYDPDVPDADMGAVSLDLYASDQQAAILRSDWEYGPDAAAVVAGFKAGVFGGRGNYERMRTGGAPGGYLNFGHDHEDDLGLWIYGLGGWLLPEAVGYNCCTSSSDYHSTVWHNSFLIDGNGQLGDDKLPSYETMSPGASHPWFLERDAEMPLHDSTDHYAFARGEGARLYAAALGVSRLTRTLALARAPAYLALRDRAELTHARQVEQLFHSLERSRHEAPWIELVNQGDTVLGVRVFAPAAPSVSISQQRSNSYQENMDDDGVFDLVSVGGRGTQVDFVELLWPTRGAAWATRPAAEPLAAAAPAAGFRVPLPGGAVESWIYAPAGAFTLGGGELAVVRRDAGGALARVALAGGGRVTEDGRALLENASGTLEVAIDGAVATLSGPAAVAGVRFLGPSVTEVRHGGAPVGFTRDGDMIVVGASPPGDAAPPVDPASPDAGPTGDPGIDPAGGGSAGHDAIGGCTAAGRGRARAAWLVLAAVGAALARRRRRRVP